MTTPDAADRLETWLARLLSLGTWACCGLLAVGMVLLEASVGLRALGTQLVTAGVVLLIALPTLRVAVMAAWFAGRRDRDLVLVAVLVLAIIVASTLLGAGGG